jgi:hypothetical protein
MIQIIKHKCCGKTFAACREPDCFTDKEWQKELRKYVLSDKVTVEMVESFTFEKCTCNKTLNLFD